MRICSVFTFIFLLTFPGGCSHGGVGHVHLADAAGDRSESYRPAEPIQWRLPNGMRVMFVEDRELPIIEGSLYFEGGTFWEAPHDVGVVSALGYLLREGGAGQRTPGQLDRYLEELSVTLRSGFATEYGSLSFSCLSENVNELIAVLADAAQRPRFDPSKLELWKLGQLSGISRRTESAEVVAGTVLGQLIFGAQLKSGDTSSPLPFGRVTLSSDIRTISVDDVKRYYKKLVNPHRAILAISGSISKEELQGFLERSFGSWRPAETTPLEEVARPVYTNTPGIYFVKVPFEQSSVYFGHEGVPRFTPEDITIDVFNEVFGGDGLSSRLGTEIRVDRGLAYSAGGGIYKGRRGGMSMVSIGTKAESTADAISAALDVLRELQAKPITEDELDHARRGITNSFIFKYESPASLARQDAIEYFLKYPEDFDDTYVSKIHGVTAEDVHSVAKKLWDLRRFVIVVAGNDTAYTTLQSLVKNGPAELMGMPLVTLKFDERGILN